MTQDQRVVPRDYEKRSCAIWYEEGKEEMKPQITQISADSGKEQMPPIIKVA
jgi:hypothetical protein